jgi:hypothetical protein
MEKQRRMRAFRHLTFFSIGSAPNFAPAVWREKWWVLFPLMRQLEVVLQALATHVSDQQLSMTK